MPITWLRTCVYFCARAIDDNVRMARPIVVIFLLFCWQFFSAPESEISFLTDNDNLVGDGFEVCSNRSSSKLFFSARDGKSRAIVNIGRTAEPIITKFSPIIEFIRLRECTEFRRRKSPVKGSPIASNTAQIEDCSSFSGPFFAYNFSPDGARTTRFASFCRSLPAASVGRVSDWGCSRFFRTVVQKPIFARFPPTFFPPPTGNAALPPDAVRRTRGSRPLPSTAGSPTRCALSQGVVSRKTYFFRFSGDPPSSSSRPGDSKRGYSDSPRRPASNGENRVEIGPYLAKLPLEIEPSFGTSCICFFSKLSRIIISVGSLSAGLRPALCSLASSKQATNQAGRQANEQAVNTPVSRPPKNLPL
jgi:hypothetical protein